MMIVLDIETTGLTHDCGICEIGAINLDKTNNYFLQNCKIDKEDTITQEALKVNGKTREQLYDVNKQTQNALEDCRLGGEVLYRAKFGKNLFLEYAKFKIPDYLKK